MDLLVGGVLADQLVREGEWLDPSAALVVARGHEDGSHPQGGEERRYQCRLRDGHSGRAIELRLMLTEASQRIEGVVESIWGCLMIGPVVPSTPRSSDVSGLTNWRVRARILGAGQRGSGQLQR